MLKTFFWFFILFEKKNRLPTKKTIKNYQMFIITVR